MNKNTLKGQEYCNKTFGFKMQEDGIFGDECRAACVKLAQLACNEDYGSGLDVDGVFGPLTGKALSGHYVKMGESQFLVKVVQVMLLLHGYDTVGIDGVFGANTYNAVLAFQKAKGLETDGIAGRDTFAALLGVNPSDIPTGESEEWKKYDPNHLPNFSSDEFKCQGPDHCGGDVVDELKCKVQLLRDKIGMPITITDGYRCPPYNESVGGTSDSLHMQGRACDIQIYTDENGYWMSEDLINRVKALAHECGMTVGTYYKTGFVHLQLGRSDFEGD